MAVGGGVEGAEGLGAVGEVALADGADRHGAALPGGEVGADVVFLDHAGDDVGEALRLADEGGDGGEALGHRVQVAEGAEAAEAGDEAVEAALVGLLELEDLDRLAQAVAGDQVLELGQRVGVELGAVAGDGVRADLVEGDLVECRAWDLRSFSVLAGG